MGLAKAQAKRRILEVVKSLPPTALELGSVPGHGFTGNAVVERIITLIEQRCALTILRPKVKRPPNHLPEPPDGRGFDSAMVDADPIYPTWR